MGFAAAANETRLELAVYGGSALMLASNFRFSTEDVDIAPLDPWPPWLSDVIADIARRRGWAPDWLNDAVGVHLSPLAGSAADHMMFGSFPRDGNTALVVSIPTPSYMLALKLKAMRTTDPVKGASEADDIFQLMRVLGLDTIEGAVQVLATYFPVSGRNADKQRFLLKHLRPSSEARSIDAPRYVGGSVPEEPGG